MKVACWSKDQPQLIIGTSKGTVLLFDASSKRVLQNLPAVHEQVHPATCWLAEVGGMEVEGDVFTGNHMRGLQWIPDLHSWER